MLLKLEICTCKLIGSWLISRLDFHLMREELGPAEMEFSVVRSLLYVFFNPFAHIFVLVILRKDTDITF